MKKALLLIVLPALLATLGFAQTPAPSTNTDQTTIKGCLGGSDGNYTVVEDNTGHIFKITTSTVDLKPHLSHEVALIGHNASGLSSAAADNNFAVTELNMISEHCAAAAAAPAATVSTPSETATPSAAATAPAATSPVPDTVAAPVVATPPAETAAAPAAAAGPPAEIPVTPAADAAPPAETAVTPAEATPPAETPVTRPAVVPAPVASVNTPSETASEPAARRRRPSHTAATATPVPDATVSSSTEPASTPAAAATTPAPIASTSTDPASTPDAVATTPAATPRSWSFWLWVAFAVLVVAIGTLFPFFSRWRRRKSLERTGAPNLSFTREVSSDKGKSDKQEPRKAA
ncbi:MAG: hypothetical protein WB660_10505 [Candidatus Sulfotelmatobacter sp.]